MRRMESDAQSNATIGLRARSFRNGARSRSRSSRVFCALIACAAATLAISSGCRSLFGVNDEGRRFEPTRGRYLDGADASRDWQTARAASTQARASRSSSLAETTARGAAPTRSYDEVEATSREAESPSFGRRVQNAFKVPFFSSRDEKNDDRNLVQSKTYAQGERVAQDSERDSRRLVEARSDVGANDKTTSFWSKIFPWNDDRFENNDALDARRGLVYREGNDPRALPNAQASRERNQNGTRATPSTSSRTRGTIGTNALFGARRRPTTAPPWDAPDAILVQYDSNAQLPSMTLIKRYYNFGATPVDPRAVASTRASAAQKRAEKVADARPSLVETVENESNATTEQEEKTARPTGGYRSRLYAPNSAPSDDGELPASPRGARSRDAGRYGAASIAPINRAAASNSSRARNLGRVRAADAVVASSRDRLPSSVAQTSYEIRGREPASRGVARTLRADSLFGWTRASASLLSAYARAGTRSVAATRSDLSEAELAFKEALGSQTSFDWFEVPEDADLSEEPMTATADAAFDRAASRFEEEEEGEIAEPTTAFENAAFVDGESTNGQSRVATQAEVDEFFATHASDAPSAPLPVEEVDESTYEEELDDVVDAAINGTTKFGEAVSDARSDASDDFEHGEIAATTDLAATISDVVDDLDAAPTALASADAPSRLLRKAEEVNEFAPAPESVDARKTESLAAATSVTDEEIAWVEQVKRAIQTLLREREEHKRRGDDTRVCDARLRLLYLVIGEYERSIREIQDESDPLKTFWEKECRGLETLLQNQLEEIDPSFVAERLRSGLDSFSGLCRLQIENALLVVAPACYGLFEERIAPYRRGDVAYAYAELEYVSSRETEEGCEINVECRWRILNRAGVEVAPFETQRCVNVSETRLRDVVLNVSVPLPENLPSDHYALELEVVDLNSSNPVAAVKRLPFTIADVETDVDGRR